MCVPIRPCRVQTADYGSSSQHFLHHLQLPSTDARRHLLASASSLDVNMHPIAVLNAATGNGYYKSVFNKLHAFNLVEYDRVIILDSDGIVYNHLDTLFTLPKTPLALPRAYWLNSKLDESSSDALTNSPRDWLTSALMVIEPDHKVYEALVEMMPGNSHANPRAEYDMDIINRLAQGWATILPHRHYFVLSAEFAGTDHSNYLKNTPGLEFNPWREYRRLKYVHFSDGPKPWTDSRPSGTCWDEQQPGCKVWHRIYDDFNAERESACRNPSEIEEEEQRGSDQ